LQRIPPRKKWKRRIKTTSKYFKDGSMIIYPAIDLKNGKCVRLLKGEFSQETVYSDDPVPMAKKWVETAANIFM